MKPKSKLTFIKFVHTLIWAFFVSTIVFVLWSGITTNISVYSWIAVAAVVGEGAVLLIFKGRCPLTLLARRYSDSRRENFDIFLPNWLAQYNKQIFGALFLIGLVLILIDALR